MKKQALLRLYHAYLGSSLDFTTDIDGLLHTGHLSEWSLPNGKLNLYNSGDDETGEGEFDIWVHPDKLTPHLRSIMSITDKEAIDVAEKVSPVNKNWTINRQDNHVEVIDKENGCRVWIWKDAEIIGDHWEEGVGWVSFSLGHCYIDLVDYLRSNGFNLDFKEGEFIAI